MCIDPNHSKLQHQSVAASSAVVAGERRYSPAQLFHQSLCVPAVSSCSRDRSNDLLSGVCFVRFSSNSNTPDIAPICAPQFLASTPTNIGPCERQSPSSSVSSIRQRVIITSCTRPTTSSSSGRRRGHRHRRPWHPPPDRRTHERTHSIERSRKRPHHHHHQRRHHIDIDIGRSRRHHRHHHQRSNAFDPILI